MDDLTEELVKEPNESHGCLFLLATSIVWSTETDAHEYEVVHDMCLMLAQEPDNVQYQGQIPRRYWPGEVGFQTL